MIRNLRPIWTLFFSAFTCFSKLIGFFVSLLYFYIELPHFLHTRYLVVLHIMFLCSRLIILFDLLFLILCVMSLIAPYAFVSLELIECIPLSSLAINVTLLM